MRTQVSQIFFCHTIRHGLAVIYRLLEFVRLAVACVSSDRRLAHSRIKCESSLHSLLPLPILPLILESIKSAFTSEVSSRQTSRRGCDVVYHQKSEGPEDKKGERDTFITRLGEGQR